MKYVLIFHSNLNYAYLVPERYEHVIRHSYEMIVDTMREHFPEQKYVFEASGYTLQQIADLTPDVLEKLKDAIDRGQCEFMGSPYGHLMCSNFPEDDVYWSLVFSQETYEKLLGLRVKSGWNPEGGWMDYVPAAYKRAGFRHLTLDFESFSVSTREEIRKVEYNPVKTGCHGLDLPWYDLPGDEPTLHFPFKDVVPGLDGFARTDRLSQVGLRYFMGEETFDAYYRQIRKFSQGDGALIVYSDDAEYIGTRGWFDVKYNDRPMQESQSATNEDIGLFRECPRAHERLISVVQSCLDNGGEFMTFEEACTTLPFLDERFFVEDGMAWHRTWSIAWASTPNAKRLEPVCNDLREKIYRAEKLARTEEQKQSVRKAWFHLTCGENTDGRWPPPPGKPHAFNLKFCEDHLEDAEKALEWVP